MTNEHAAMNERKARILDAALATQRSRVRRRRIVRGAGAAIPVVALVAWAWMTPPGTPLRQPDPTHVPIAAIDPLAEQPKPEWSFDFALVRTNRERVRSYITHSPPLSAQRLSDKELAEGLRDLGRPDGVVRAGGVVMLASEARRNLSPDPPPPGV